MAKKTDSNIAAMSETEALGGPVVPLESVLPAGKPQAAPEASAEAPPPTPSSPGSQIRRKAASFAGKDGVVMVAGIGEVKKQAGLPAFLAGPDPDKRKAAELINAIRRSLAQQITSLQTVLPEVTKALAALESLGDTASAVAAHESFDLAKAEDITRELQEAVDRAVK